MLKTFISTFALCMILIIPGSGMGEQREGEINQKLPIFPKSSPPAKNMYHINLLEIPDGFIKESSKQINNEEQLNLLGDIRFTLTILQGIVNRDKPQIYITQNPEWHGPALIPKWIEGIKNRGYTFEDISDPFTLVEIFRDKIKGVILYESKLAKNPESLHKINSITLYCALNDVIPATPEINDRLNLPVILDLRGKYNKPIDAYRWAYNELWPKANHKMLAHTHPTHMVLRDYLVTHKIMPIWISQAMSKEEEELCLRFLDETEANTPLIGCWGGYGENPPGRFSEAILQRLASLRGKFLTVMDGCFNLTVHSGFKFKKSADIKSKRKLKLDKSKVYICFNFTDGDNLQYLQQYFGSKQWWDDPNRGKVPIGWSMSSNAAELFPDILEYFLSTKTENDEFVMPTAGVGLVTPALYGKDLYSNYDSVYKSYIKLTAQSMKQVGLTTIQLGDTSSVPWTRGDFGRWGKEIKFLDGIIGDYGGIVGVDKNNAAFIVNGVPVARAIVGSPDLSTRGDQPQKAWSKVIKNITPAKRPAFVHVSVINWYDSPTSIMNAVKELGAAYVPVLPTELFDLMKQADETY